MNETFLDTLFYLFEQMLHGKACWLDRAEALAPNVSLSACSGNQELLLAPARLNAVSAPSSGKPSAQPIRIFDATELATFDLQTRGFLLTLEQDGLITATQREIILQRALSIEQESLDIMDITWLVLFVLCDTPAMAAANAKSNYCKARLCSEPVH